MCFSSKITFFGRKMKKDTELELESDRSVVLVNSALPVGERNDFLIYLVAIL